MSESKYTAKNASRRSNYDRTNEDHVEARELRRRLNGTFGRLPVKSFNILSNGTGALPR